MARKGVLLGVVLCMVILPVLASDRSPVRTDVHSLLSAFLSHTDLRIRSVQQSLEILASTAEVKSGKWEAMKGLLEVYQKSDGKLAVWYVLPDGTYYTADKGLMDVKLSDRSYFPDLMAGRKIIGSLVVSKSTGQRSAVSAIPIVAEGKVVAAVGVSLFLDRLAEDVGAALSLRPDASFFALAPNGQTTLHLKTDRHFLDPRELGSETLKTAVNEMLSQNAGETTYFFDNINKQAIYRTSPLTQWKFVIVSNAAEQTEAVSTDLETAEEGEMAMTTFIMTGRYSAESLKKVSAKRTTEATKIIRQCDGEIVAVYATMGKNDLLAIVEFPGVSEAMKASIELNKALGITFSTVPAIALEDFDKLVGAKR